MKFIPRKEGRSNGRKHTVSHYVNLHEKKSLLDDEYEAADYAIVQNDPPDSYLEGMGVTRGAMIAESYVSCWKDSFVKHGYYDPDLNKSPSGLGSVTFLSENPDRLCYRLRLITQQNQDGKDTKRLDDEKKLFLKLMNY